MNTNRIKKAIYNALVNVPYYNQTLLKSIDINELSFDDFTKFPIVDKSIYINDYEQFISKMCSKNSLIQEFTSGSTGQPFICYKSVNDLFRIKTSLFKHRKNACEKLNVTDNYIRLYGSWSEMNIEKNALLLSIFYINMINKYFQSVLNFQPKWLFGTPTAVVDFVNVLESQNKIEDFRNNVNLHFIEVTGEILTENQIAYLKKVLHVPIINHYGCREVWHVAFSCTNGNLHIAEDNVFVQIVDENNNDLEDADGEIIITSLNCFDVPFIKYRTGDIGRLVRSKCACGSSSAILSLSGGRCSDYITLKNGGKLSSVYIHHVFRKLFQLGFTGIDTYYVKQNDVNTFTFYLKTNDLYSSINTENKILEIMNKKISETKILFIYCQNTIRNESGKKKFFEGI